MWDCLTTYMDDGTEHYKLRLNRVPVSYSETIRRWQEDMEFCSYFSSLLAASLLLNFRWETPPVSEATVGACDFEFVLVDAPELARPADRLPFSRHFANPPDGRDVMVVPNIGRDALMVVPIPVGPDFAYSDLAGFVRHSPESQQASLWRAVGQTMQRRLSDKPVWLSTAGAGVAWLHVRLDNYPKYYCCAPYRIAR